MKSIVQEASTIAKAVEKGWKQAGEPQDFSVKVLELPEHNFIGLTTRSAKIAIIFTDKPAKPHNDRKKSHQQSSPQQQRTQAPKQQPREHDNTKRQAAKPQQKQERPANNNHTQPQKQTLRPLPQEKTETAPEKAPRKKAEGLWNDELTAFADKWLKTTVGFIDKSVTFTVEPQNFYLRVTFNKPILPDEAKEKHLLASLSSLMLAAVKKEFRKALRGHKIVLTHAQ